VELVVHSADRMSTSVTRRLYYLYAVGLHTCIGCHRRQHLWRRRQLTVTSASSHIIFIRAPTAVRRDTGDAGAALGDHWL